MRINRPVDTFCSGESRTESLERERGRNVEQIVRQDQLESLHELGETKLTHLEDRWSS